MFLQEDLNIASNCVKTPNYLSLGGVKEITVKHQFTH